MVRAYIAIVLFVCQCVSAAELDRVEWVIDCATEAGAIRSLHGVNAGPLDAGGTVDLSAHHRALKLPLTRLHDCNWPHPDVVDMHAVFPNPQADPAKPESYEFIRTDAYVRSVLATGSRIIYRLGESIEHGPDKRRLHPPADPQRWADACVGIIRHYNEGWAGGFRYDIRYWEIWNEPENRPNCWTGSDEEFLRLFVTAAKTIKQRFPNVKVGGPAFGNVGRVEDGTFRPTPFVTAFLERCRAESVPLDFFSWHWYGNDAGQLFARARGIRDLLDRHGFGQTESHLNEWNYLPDNDWGPMLVGGQGLPRRRFYDRVGGAEGAAFAASVLIGLQDQPVDAANYFTANTQGFGLFDPAGIPKKSYYAFKAFATLADVPARLKSSASDHGRATACAGKSREGDRITILVTVPTSGDQSVLLDCRNLPWPVADYEELRVDETRDLSRVSTGKVTRDQSRIRVSMRGPAVTLLTLRKPAS